MPKRNRTREQKDRDNARRRALRAEGKRLGLSPAERSRAGAVRAAAEAERKRAEAAAKAAARKPRKKRTRRDETGARPAPKHRTDAEHFRRFVMEHPQLSANEVQKEYRRQGFTIGRERAYDITREVRDEAKHYEKMRFKRYTYENAPFKVQPPYKDRFYYVVRYQTMREGQPEPYEEHITITNDTRLSAYEIVKRVYEYFYKAREDGLERYKLKNILPDSIVILLEIDFGVDWRHRRRKTG